MAGDDERWMRRALALAEHGRGTTSPNPMVGCVIVRNREVVGEGFHVRAGEPHAEVVALAAAEDRAAGATVYVTLEPCDHTGRTGPCSTALLDAGVTRVVAAIEDPNPLAAGGAERLRSRGVDVDIGVCAADAAQQNEIFLHSLTRTRPFVVLKCATSLDGRVAAADGTSRWLTGEATRERAHALRAEADAILVGSGTVLADDPRLTVRLPDHEGPQPLRVVLDRRGRVPADARMLDDEAPALVLSTDILQTCKELWNRDVRSLLVEGGPQIASAFLAAGVVDRLVVHVAPLLLGPAAAPLTDGGPPTLAAATRWRLAATEQVGDDVMLTYYPPRDDGPEG
ncbi:MAG: bifunctional diaminohydroxyphosphoribosylaminopyrimidine deaminase/5-amino-6-(5-phosphoribosylamino)uracil reductase RibD [Egibacteraceae bacterium]